MKKKILVRVIATVLVIGIGCGFLTGCDEASRVSYNLSQQADNFNVTRRLAVINLRTDKVEFELIGNFSIETDNTDGQLEITCEVGPHQYRKHFVRLATENMYVVEDLGSTDVSKYHYEVNFLPQLILPFSAIISD